MYKNNFGYDPNDKKNNKNNINSFYIFETLFKKLKESELNNESLWKIILTDIILEFSEKLDLKDKNYVFELIKKYYDETATKKNSKIIQLFSFIINYSLKCMNSNGSNPNERDEKDFLFKENKLGETPENSKNKDKYDEIIKGSFNEKKFYCLEMLISHLVNKDIINNLQINNELKLSVIKKYSLKYINNI